MEPTYEKVTVAIMATAAKLNMVWDFHSVIVILDFSL
jgi:hypothetical protein